MASFQFRRGMLAGVVAPSFLAGALLGGCGGYEPRQEITTIEEPSANDLQPVPDLSTAQRMRVQPPPGQEPTGAQEVSAFEWDTPDGWTERPPTPLRSLNFHVAGNPDAECYLTVLDGDGGGLLANINRWYGQVGQDGITEEELAALEEFPLLGAPAKFVQMEGAFTGMGGGPARENYQIAGLANIVDGKAYFLKMTGPTALVSAEIEAMKTLAASIVPATAGLMPDTTRTVSAPVSEEAADLPQPVVMPDAPSAYGDEAPTEAEAPAASAAPTGPIDPSQLQWDAPEGWTEGAPRAMRLVTYTVGESECYVTVLPGQAGGVVSNINRWFNQMAQEPLSEAEIEGLPTVSVLGQEAPFVVITGDYTGMAAATLEDQMLLGTVVTLPNHSIFIKMTGPQAEVAEEQENFKAFCASLRP